MLSRLKWIPLVLLAFVAGQPVRCEGAAPRLRVGLALHQGKVSFSGPAGVTVRAASEDQVACEVAAGELWEATAAKDGVVVAQAGGGGHKVMAGGARLSPPEGGTVTIHGVPGHWDTRADRDYRGAIEVRRDGAGGLNVINVVDAETYLCGVVPSEMPAAYPRAALQAQAVAARGQLLAKAGRHEADGFDLCATAHCQVYGGATSEDPRSNEAVSSTRGEVLVYEGRLADTLYSSTCGGHTASNEDYWPNQQPVPYLRGQPDFEPEDGVGLSFPLRGEDLEGYLKYAPRVNCNQSRYAASEKIRWWMAVPKSEMERQLRERLGDFGELLDVRVAKRADCGMVTKLAVIGTRQLIPLTGGEAIRRAIDGLQSASFAVRSFKAADGTPVVFLIWGAGWGHQVGMCQVGAAGLAEKGWDYQAILAKYYQGCMVEERY
jgi:SpoIID/LytB domain protein